MKSTLFSALAFVFIASNAVFAAEGDVELIEKGKRFKLGDVVLTTVSTLEVNEDQEVWYFDHAKTYKLGDIFNFAESWEQRFINQYLGVVLKTKKVENKYQFDGKLAVYMGAVNAEEKNEGLSQKWPQSEIQGDRSYRQTREAAKRFSLVGSADSKLQRRLRIYYAPVSIGYEYPSNGNKEGMHKYDDSLIIAYVDEDTAYVHPDTDKEHEDIGKKTLFTFRNGRLYRLRNLQGFPQDATMATSWYIVRPGATYKGKAIFDGKVVERTIPSNLVSQAAILRDDDDNPSHIYGAEFGKPFKYKNFEIPSAKPIADGDKVVDISALLQAYKNKTTLPVEKYNALPNEQKLTDENFEKWHGKIQKLVESLLQGE